jgi:hypothetical protein
LLIRNGSSVPSEDPSTLAGFTTLNECRDGSYVRQTPANVTLTRVSPRVRVTSDRIYFDSAGDQSSDEIVGVLLLIHTGSTADNWIPLAYDAFEASKYLNGGTIPYSPDATEGLLSFKGELTSGVSLTYTSGILGILDGSVDLDGTGKVRQKLLMTSSSALASDLEHLADITTLDECDASGYAEQAVTGVAVSGSAGVVIMDANNAEFTNAGAATRAVRFLLTYLRVGASGDAAVDLPLACARFDTDTTLDGTTFEASLSPLGFAKFTV